MMSRIPFVAAVVGALLVGGATTGATHASWTGQRQLQPHGVTAGRMSFTATSPGAVAVDKTATSSATTSFVLDDTSAGKKLVQRLTATVTGTPTGVTATVGTSCATATTTSVFVDTTPTSVDQTLCVKVTSSATAVSGSVTVTTSGAQRPTGWISAAVQRTVAVTVNAAAPAAPTITCQPRSGNNISFSWPTVSGQTYSVHQATTNTDASYSAGSASSGDGVHTVAPATGSTIFYRVKAIGSGGTSGFSNTVRIVRTGQGASTISCSPVTP